MSDTSERSVSASSPELRELRSAVRYARSPEFAHLVKMLEKAAAASPPLRDLELGTRVLARAGTPSPTLAHVIARIAADARAHPQLFGFPVDEWSEQLRSAARDASSGLYGFAAMGVAGSSAHGVTVHTWTPASSAPATTTPPPRLGDVVRESLRGRHVTPAGYGKFLVGMATAGGAVGLTADLLEVTGAPMHVRVVWAALLLGAVLGLIAPAAVVRNDDPDEQHGPT